MNPRNKRQVNFQGTLRDAFVVEVQISRENWNEYVLEDGTVIKMKPVVTEVMRVDGVYDNEGNPLYLIKSTNVTNTNATSDLKRKQ